ncbi:hypothetical protein [Prevotella pallens]|uniref:hypothetical protein n=1 Tax=Prevotella pallens TaxID=60133 RepID=UPI0028E93771|nr:hypothetical protein [Prevotella pallens]
MEIKLQCGDTIAIPDGCKATIKDGSVVIEKEEQKEQEFKDGDVLAYKNSSSNTFPFIYKDTDEDGFYIFYVGVDCSENIQLLDDADDRWGNAPLRLATEEEKQLLFDKMKEQGLKWNAEKKRVETIRWRAPEKCNYWCCAIDLNVIKTADYRYEADHKMCDCGNYFRTKEKAEEAAKRVKEVLYKYHEEIGE